MLKRFLPRSLLGRSLLILGTPLILVQIISIWVFYGRHVDDLTRRMAVNFAGEMRLTMNHIRDYDNPSDLVWVLAEVHTNLNLRATLHKGKKFQPGEHVGADTRSGAELIRVMEEMRFTDFIIDTESIPRHIRVELATPSGVLEIITTRKKIETLTTDLFLAWSIGSSIVLLIIAGIFMRNQVKPIRRLAQAADSFGKGRDVPHFKPSGAKEVRQASTAFIIMRERIRRQIQQRTEMLAGVSHDLRAPLTRMKLQLAMLDAGEEDVRALEADVAEMEAMVEEYLAFARGEGMEQAVATSLSILLKDVTEAAQRNGHEIALRTRGNLKVIVRPNGFKRALSNLVANAARYGDRIQVQAQRRSGFVEITVDDNGPGVPEAKREEVFQPFVRVDDARTPDKGGAGLGLTIARDIVRGHGGDILLSDSPLGGLRAILRLPV